jgi:hypothetical protein
MKRKLGDYNTLFPGLGAKGYDVVSSTGRGRPS